MRGPGRQLRPAAVHLLRRRGNVHSNPKIELEKMTISGKPVAGVPHFPGGPGARLRQVLLQQQSLQPKLPPAAVMKEAAAWMMGASGNKARMFFPAHRFIAAHNIRYNPALWLKARYPEEILTL